MEINPLFPAQGQALVFLIFAAAGALSAAISALVRALFGAGRMRIAGSFLSGALCAIMGCTACVFAAGGVLRAYMLPAMGAGASLAHFLLIRPAGLLLQKTASLLRPYARRIASCAPVRRLLK